MTGKRAQRKWALAAAAAVFLVLSLSGLKAAEQDAFRLTSAGIMDLAPVLDAFLDRDYFEKIYVSASMPSFGGPGLKEAQNAFVLGVLFQYGIGTEADAVRAAEWYGVAAGGGYLFPFLGREAEKALAELTRGGLPDGTARPLNRQEQEAAAAGSGALFALALRYQHGLCAPLDFGGFARCMIQAAEAGHPEAAEYVVSGFLLGLPGFSQDVPRAVEWLTRGGMGNPVKRKQLARIYAMDDAAGLDDDAAEAFLRMCIREGDEGALLSMGRFLLRTNRAAEALPFLEQAADAGDTGALSQLTVMYRRGTGVPADEARAKEYAARFEAAEAGNRTKTVTHAEKAAQALEDARILLAMPEPDWQEAGLVLMQAVSGFAVIPEACLLLADIQEHGRCGEPNLYAAGRLYRQAAESGLTEGMLALARLHRDGAGVRRDLAEAKKWALRAQEAGSPEAVRLLRQIGEAAAEPAAGKEPWRERLRKPMAEAHFRASLHYSYRQRPEEMREPMRRLLLSAENGCPEGQYLAGLLLLTGEPRLEIAADRDRALHFLEQAAAAGIAGAAEKRAHPDSGPGFREARAAGMMRYAEEAREAQF